MDAVTELKCPNCGAAVEPGGKSCSYCGSTFTVSRKTNEISLSARKCPVCDTLNSPDAAYCEACSEPLLEECRNCKKPIPVSTDSCRFCGAVHHLGKRKADPDLDRALQLSIAGEYAEADDLFNAGERKHKENSRLYAGWITNYWNWADSFESDLTMQTFVHEYREKAKQLLELVGEKFKDDPAFEAVRSLVSGVGKTSKPRQPEDNPAGFFKFILFVGALIAIFAAETTSSNKTVLVVLLVIVSVMLSKNSVKNQTGGK